MRTQLNALGSGTLARLFRFSPGFICRGGRDELSSDDDRLKLISTLRHRAALARKLAATAMSPELVETIESYARDLDMQVAELEAATRPETDQR